jgi:hypothetical protein
MLRREDAEVELMQLINMVSLSHVFSVAPGHEMKIFVIKS